MLTFGRKRLSVKIQDQREAVLRGLVRDGNRVQCPSCAVLLGIPESASGDHMKCPKCLKIFMLLRSKGVRAAAAGTDAAAAAASTDRASSISLSSSSSATASEQITRSEAADIWSRVATNDASVPLLMAEEYSPLLDDVLMQEASGKK